MKLHLPKQLFTALLAAITLAAPAEAIGIGQWTSYDIRSSSETAVTTLDGASVSWVTSDGTAVITGIPSYTFRFELTPDWNLGDGAKEDLVYVTSAGNMWGFYAYGDGSIAAKSTNGLYTTDENTNDAATDGIVSKDSILNSEETSVTLQASINNSGTLLKKSDDTVLYHETGLKWSADAITGLNANTNYISAIQVITAVDTIDTNRPVIVRNQSGSWEKEFSANDTKFILAKDKSEGGANGRMDVTDSAELNGYSNVVVGGSNQLFLQTYKNDGCSANILLDQDIYIGSTSIGAAIRFGMDHYDVTLSGDIYLVDNASMSGSNPQGHTITLSGTITDRVVNSQGTTIDTNSTLTLNNGRYDITGTVDVSGFTVQAGVVNVSSGTGNFGNVTLNGGELNVSSETGNFGNVALKGGNLNYTGGTHTITGTLISESAGKGIKVGTTDGQRAVLNVNRMELGNIESGTAADTLTIYEGSALKVTGSVNTDTNFKSRSIVIGEWTQQTVVDVYGDFLAQGAAMYAGIKGGSVNIHSTGTVAVKGLATARTSETGSVLNVTLHDGGKLILGDTGIAADTVGANIIFNSGTVGMFAQATTIGTNITLQSQDGTVFDSSLYTFSADGLSLQQGSTGGTMTISGAVTGSGKLVKDGAGTLKLSGANTYTGGTTVKGGVLQIASGGSAGTGAVEVQTGATLDVAALPTDWTAASMLSGKVTGTGTLLISKSGLSTGNANLTTTFGGTLELAKGVTFTLGNGNGFSQGLAINTSSLASVVLNAGTTAAEGSKLEYNASGVTTMKNLTVKAFSESEKGTATLYYKDSNSANSVTLDGVTQLDGNLDITTWYDGGVRIKQLSGAGNLSVTGRDGAFNASIESIQNKYTGSLSFSDDQLNATVSTGTGEGTLSMGSITASGVANFTFNVQRNTELTSLATASNAKVNLADGTSLTLGGATNTTIGTLSAASGATLTLDTNASLTVGTYNAVHTLTISGNGASAGLGFTSITVDNNSHQLTLEGEGSISFVHNRDAVDNASADGNGFRVNTGKYVLFDGYEWTADENHTLTANGFTLDENQTDGKTILISSGTAGNVFYVNQSNATAYDAGFVADTLNTGTAVEILAGQTLSVETATDVTLDKQLRGEGSLSKTGAGTLTLSGANTYTGGTTVQEGELIVSSANSLGTGSVQLEAGSTLTLGASVTNAILVNGTGANINLSNGVTLTHNGKVTINDGASINYTLDGAILNLSNTAITSGISSIDMKNDSMVQLHTATNNLGGENARVAINMSGNSALSLKNGWEGNVWADINVDGSGRILGSVSGNNAVVKGSIKGNGSLLLGRSDTTYSNAWKIESLISDNESGKLSVAFDATDGEDGPSKVTLSGANTYSGGTTIENGHLYTENASALGTGKVTVNAGGVLNVAENLKLQDTLQLSGAGKVQVATGKSLNLQDKVNLSSTDGTNAATMTAKADGTALAQLAEDASFTIEDMTLTNTTITAATPTTQVKLQNVTASNVVLAKGKFTMGETAQVGMSGAGSYDFTTSSLSGITLQNSVADGVSSSTLVVDLGDLSCVTAMGPGKYDLSITLSGFTMQDYTQGIVFAADSWLGQLLTAQGATAYVSGTVETPASVSEGGSTGGVSVSYSAATGGNVGTVITITGLNVPEPASATLGLAALMMLCARRRRKA